MKTLPQSPTPLQDIENMSGGRAIGYLGGVVVLITFIIIAVRSCRFPGERCEAA